MKCVFCKTDLPNPREWNNPAPVSHNGKCCAACNVRIVIPARVDEYLRTELIATANTSAHDGEMP